MAEQSAWGFQFPDISGGTLALDAFRGNVLLVANTASFCGYTDQYRGLQKLHDALGACGLTVIGVPSKDFNQESDDDETVRAFCEQHYGVTFPLAGISHVRGAQAAPFYAWVKAVKRWEPSWNFNKVLVARDGSVAGTFGSGDAPEGAKVQAGIQREIEKPT